MKATDLSELDLEIVCGGGQKVPFLLDAFNSAANPVGLGGQRRAPVRAAGGGSAQKRTAVIRG